MQNMVLHTIAIHMNSMQLELNKKIVSIKQNIMLLVYFSYIE